VKLRHLTSRFVRALWPGPARADDREWVATMLTPDELELWRRMPNHDQRHSAGVARRVDAALAGTRWAGDRRWLEAALLHDVGKVDAGLSVPGRVAATVVIVARGREEVASAADAPGYRGRIARYSQHPARGAALIDRAGGSPEAARWAATHHDSAPPPGIPDEVVAALWAADDD
jgi:hypothetical protein